MAAPEVPPEVCTGEEVRAGGSSRQRYALEGEGVGAVRSRRRADGKWTLELQASSAGRRGRRSCVRAVREGALWEGRPRQTCLARGDGFRSVLRADVDSEALRCQFLLFFFLLPI